VIPDYQTVMLPILQHLRAGQELSMADLIDQLSADFQLNDEERQRMLPSGTSTYIGSRTGWARTYLKKAGLVDSPRRGFVQITDRGRQVLAENPARVDTRFLTQFSEFREFHGQRREDESLQPIATAPASTPEEAFESAYESLRQSIEADLLERVKALSPGFFEQMVVKLHVGMGYGGSIRDAGQAIGRSGDGGIDGIIKQDRLGLDAIFLQAKRWESVVGRPEIQKFAGALQGHRAKKGVFITTSSFSKEAVEYVRMIDVKIVLIDGLTLASLMAEHSIGVSTVRSFPLLKVDPDFFIED
jgi:restriction system protein